MKRALAAAVIIAAGLAAGCGSPARPQAGAPAGGVVPWADWSAAPYAEPGPRTFATDARPCRPADLRASHGRSGVGLGNTNVAVQFTNRSAAACVLLGYPTVAGISPGGAITPLAAAHGSYFGDPGPPANIALGQTAAFNVSGADACPAAHAGQHGVYRRLRIGLPGGGHVDAAVPPFDAICGVSVSQFGVPADQPAAPPPSPLTARITAAATVRPGADFTYTVPSPTPPRRRTRCGPAPPTRSTYTRSPAPARPRPVRTTWPGTTTSTAIPCTRSAPTAP
jgi:Domain of unknown function (DUF4232)